MLPLLVSGDGSERAKGVLDTGSVVDLAFGIPVLSLMKMKEKVLSGKWPKMHVEVWI